MQLGNNLDPTALGDDRLSGTFRLEHSIGGNDGIFSFPDGHDDSNDRQETQQDCRPPPVTIDWSITEYCPVLRIDGSLTTVPIRADRVSHLHRYPTSVTVTDHPSNSPSLPHRTAGSRPTTGMVGFWWVVFLRQRCSRCSRSWF